MAACAGCGLRPSLLSIAWVALSVHLGTGEDRRVVESTTLAEVFAALQQNEELAGRWNGALKYVVFDL